MIIRPIEGFKDHYQSFDEKEQDSLDILVSNMLTSALILKTLTTKLQEHYIQLPFRDGKTLQFIIDDEEDALVVRFYIQLILKPIIL